MTVGEKFDWVVIEDAKKIERIKLNSADGSIVSRSAHMVAVFIANGDTGELSLAGVNTPGQGSTRIRFEPAGANVWLGGNGQDGSLLFFRRAGDNKTINDSTIYIEGGNGQMRLGGNGTNGDLALFPGGVTGADLKSRDNATIHLDGAAGDITLRNADCAEDFDIAETEGAVPGAVMVIDAEGKLRPSREAYDKRVAGVLSGAGDFKPGIVLDKQRVGRDRLPVALVGKVYCYADAQPSAIEVGDLLTTSATPGHAMKASDPLKAFGAVIGKALRPLAAGRGLIPILIALQ
jgi:hypothetical protein